MSRSRITFRLAVLALALAAGSQLALAQSRIEVGFGGGGSLYTEKTVSAPAGEAKTGFEPGFAVNGWVAQDLYRYLSGEVHYSFQMNDLKLTGAGPKYTFGGRAHSIYYNLLIHTAPSGAKTRAFVAVGGGIKGYQGTGEEIPNQPGQDFVLLSKTTDWKGLVVFGGGIKYALSDGVVIRAEVYDYFTQTPVVVLQPAPGAELGGWIHNIVPSFGIGFRF